MIREGYNIITGHDAVDRVKWMSFTESCPGGNIFQTPVMADFFAATAEYSPVALFCTDGAGEICGLVVSYVLRESSGLTGYVSSRAIVWGGPLVRTGNEEVAELLLRALKKALRGRVTYLQVRNLTDTSSIASSFARNGFSFDDHLDLLFDLTREETVLWDSIHPTRRKQIRRAVRRGVVTEVDLHPGREKTAECYEILKRLYTQIKLPFPGFQFFDTAVSMLGATGSFGAVTASLEGRIIGFRFFLLFKGQIYDWYAASLQEHYDKYPNDILPWELIRWGHENRHRLFDFGGAGNPAERYGVRDYKQKFGGVQVNYGRYTYIFRPLVYYPVRMIFNLLRRVAR